MTDPLHYDAGLLSVVMRFHDPRRLPLFEEAVFSLAIQDWPDLEIVVAAQNASPELLDSLLACIARQPWLELPGLKFLSVDMPPSVDGRSRLLNAGLGAATGRYVAFLDDDDVVYQHGYRTLISRLESGDAAIAVGRSRVAKLRPVADSWFVVSKGNDLAWGRDSYDLFRDNFITIHSYVIDRQRMRPEDLHFDESFAVYEDYEFLLRQATLYAIDYSAVDVPVCEYRIRLDGSNTLAVGEDGKLQVTPSVLQGRERILRRKQELHYPIPLAELLQPSASALLDELWESRSWRLTRGPRNFIRRLRGQAPETKPTPASEAEAWSLCLMMLFSVWWNLTAPLRMVRRLFGGKR